MAGRSLSAVSVAAVTGRGQGQQEAGPDGIQKRRDPEDTEPEDAESEDEESEDDGSILTDLLGLIAPRFCAGCNRPGRVLCPGCRRLFAADIARPAPTGLIACGHVYSCARYEGAARHAVLGWKDHDDIEAGRLLARLLCALTDRILPRAPGLAVAVVPVPSSRRSVRRRGRRHILELSAPLVRDLRRRGFDARQVRALALRGTSAKSVARTHAGQRRSRSRTAFRLAPAARRLRPGEAVILVDDICTTGATLLACSALLAGAGHRPLVALTLATVVSDRDPQERRHLLAFHRELVS
jgi:predicted amidophosphoribosyltransferase